MSRQRNGYSPTLPTTFEELDALMRDYPRLRYIKNFYILVMFELKLDMLYLVWSKMALNCYILDC
jgi:phosphatidylglycerophosphatase A